MPKNHFYKLAGAVFLLATLIFVFSTPTPVRAATFEVNEPDDTLSDTVCDAVCTLRDAIFEANAAAGSDTIQFNLGGGGVLASLSFPFGVLPDI
ncbi:MAG: hypothetical protein H7Y09_03955, partial [Chitinophagaceae bacterium]|nr:hypothetical protein [Anaerolineae bacterium]